ncbi:CST complex subunit CTC1 [Trichomycterus rosablanca]|uniref:CST complex subunit CTC1 n=1 Tax=Trichomycterus rosablanca TaxID=2290929 RepID=UPI002F35E289
MEEFMEHYQDRTALERAWLSEVYTGVCEQVYPLVGVALGLSAEQLSHAVVWRVQRVHQSLPVTYRCVSVAELCNRQRTPCLSSLTWSTAQYRDRIREAEQQLPNQKGLQRANLLLIGVMCDGRDLGQCEGCWRVRDCSGSVHCEVLGASPLWCGTLMLFPTWNYIPHDAPGPGQDGGGYLELIDPPVCVTGDPVTLDPVGSLGDAIGVKKAARLLREKNTTAVCVSVYGEVGLICPLLVISGKPFFCCTLTEGERSVPLLVTVPECVYWRQCVCVGQSVCVSALRVCSVRGWAGHRVLSVTPESRLHPNPRTPSESGDTGTQSQSLTDTDMDEDVDTHAQSLTDAHTPLQEDTPSTELPVHHGPSAGVNPARTKLSKIISYRGRITAVLNQEAGLYELDGKVTLCLAYQPLRKWGGGLRPGAELKLDHVHFLFRPSAFFAGAVLSACLRTTVSVTAFSPLGSKVTSRSSDSALVRFLMEKNLGVSEYFWLCYCSAALADRLSPRWVCPARVCVLAGRLLHLVSADKQPRRDKRDIYREMLQDTHTHTCPLTQYCVCTPCESLYSVKELFDWLENESWACLSSLSTLLPPSACHMTRSELNPLLLWSAHTHTLSRALEHTLLVGVLELSASRATVRLVDRTGAIDCVCVQGAESGESGVSVNTAWIGCLVCIQRCTLVMERFMKTDFPSWKHLDQHRYITHKHCRVYICVCMDDLHILSPSSAMSALTPRRERERKRTRTDPPSLHQPEDRRPETPQEQRPGPEEPEEPEEDQSRPGPSQTGKRKREAEGEGRSSDPCVSLVFRVLSKQGVAFRNLQATNQAQALTLSFTVEAARLGGVQVWDRDPKNGQVEQREIQEAEEHLQVQLLFINAAVRWFPLIHPGTVYRLIATNTQDMGVMSCSSVPTKGGVSLIGSPALLVQPQWRIHTLAPSPLLPQTEVQKIMSVSELLHSSSCEVVSVCGVITERITLQEDRKKHPTLPSLINTKECVVETDLKVRLTLQDSDSPHHTVQVYLDFTHNPYTPGLITGATVLLHHFQRRVSTVKNVYCCSLPVSCVTVTGCGSAKPRPPPPMMHLGEWASGRAGQSIVGQVRGHVVRVLFLRLQWACSLCGSVFKQASCTQTSPPCDSTSAVFQAEAKVVLDDGTGEAQVWFSSEMVARLLQLSDCEWEGLQRLIRVKGHVRVYTRGWNVVCDVDPDDPLLLYLCCLCSSGAVCRNLTLTCKVRPQKPEKAQLRKMNRGEREFLTKFPPALQLQCTHIHTHTLTHTLTYTHTHSHTHTH